MQAKEDWLTFRGRRLRIFCWCPDLRVRERGDSDFLKSEVAVRGVLIFLPGQGDFSRRYEALFRGLVEERVAVLMCDWPGHGESSGHRGHVGSLRFARKLIDHLITYARGQFEGAEIGLGGHSMGALMALDGLSRNPELRFGWLSSPLLDPARNKSRLTVWLARYFGWALPGLTIDTGVDWAACVRGARGLESEGPPPAVKEGGGHTRISIGWGRALLNVAGEVWGQRDLILRRRSLLITQGDADDVCEAGICREFINGVGANDIDYLEIVGARHEPFSDESRDMVVKRLIESVPRWIGK